LIERMADTVDRPPTQLTERIDGLERDIARLRDQVGNGERGSPVWRAQLAELERSVAAWKQIHWSPLLEAGNELRRRRTTRQGGEGEGEGGGEGSQRVVERAGSEAEEGGVRRGEVMTFSPPRHEPTRHAPRRVGAAAAVAASRDVVREGMVRQRLEQLLAQIEDDDTLGVFDEAMGRSGANGGSVHVSREGWTSAREREAEGAADLQQQMQQVQQQQMDAVRSLRESNLREFAGLELGESPTREETREEVAVAAEASRRRLAYMDLRMSQSQEALESARAALAEGESRRHRAPAISREETDGEEVFGPPDLTDLTDLADITAIPPLFRVTIPRLGHSGPLPQPRPLLDGPVDLDAADSFIAGTGVGGRESPSTAAAQIRESAFVSQSAATSELGELRREVAELKALVRSMSEVLLDVQRSVRQEVAAAMYAASRPSPRVAVAKGGLATPAAAASLRGPVVPHFDPASQGPYTRAGECIACCDVSADAMLYRCGHLCLCMGCARTLYDQGNPCPVCRAPIADVVQCFSAGGAP